MRVDALPKLPSQVPVDWIYLIETEYQRLLEAVLSNLDRNEIGVTKPFTVAGFTQTDAFFAAHGDFNIFQTCNVWVGRMLKEAGLRFGRWTPTTFSVRLSLRVNGLLE